jgi:hypothetical protein
LAAGENLANCNVNASQFLISLPAASCIFSDITAGTITVPCKQGSPDCSREPPEKIGVLTGFNSGVGYDLATGLGSVNAENLVNNWPTQ